MLAEPPRRDLTVYCIGLIYDPDEDDEDEEYVSVGYYIPGKAIMGIYLGLRENESEMLVDLVSLQDALTYVSKLGPFDTLEIKTSGLCAGVMQGNLECGQDERVMVNEIKSFMDEIDARDIVVVDAGEEGDIIRALDIAQDVAYSAYLED